MFAPIAARFVLVDTKGMVLDHDRLARRGTRSGSLEGLSRPASLARVLRNSLTCTDGFK